MFKQMLIAVALLGLVACKPNLTPVAQIANVAGQIEATADTIVLAAAKAQQTNLLTTQQLAAVAIIGDIIGRTGKNLDAGLVAYNAAKAAGNDTTKLAVAIQQEIGVIVNALSDLGKQIPNGTVQAIDQGVVTILGLVAQVKAGLAL